MNKRYFELIVGDNAFHGISHLSQQRARDRLMKNNPTNVENAFKLVRLSLQNGATGFMFSVSKTTLSILESLKNDQIKPDLYAIVPYAYEYVRLATTVGGIPGLAKQVSREIVLSKNIFSVAPYLIDFLRTNPSAFLKTYLIYELSRIKSVAGKKANLKSVLLHEVITDMALALDLDWFFKCYIKFLNKSNILPGFETRNFPYLVDKFRKWGFDMNNMVITASFNKIGFQMNPSKLACEEALQHASGAQIIAMSVLAAGYLKPLEAANYVASLPSINGVVVGVSSERHASETFVCLNNRLNNFF